ncbi:hypothetical protein Gotur_004418, partial [Gossypium turneri]
MEDLILKKVQFMDNDESVNREVLVDLTNVLVISWKDKLVGIPSNNEDKGLEEEEEFEIHHILIWDMENTVVLKLLGRNIGYSVLHSKIYSLWKSSSPFQFMDIENGYFLAKLKKKNGLIQTKNSDINDLAEDLAISWTSINEYSNTAEVEIKEINNKIIELFEPNQFTTEIQPKLLDIRDLSIPKDWMIDRISNASTSK